MYFRAACLLLEVEILQHVVANVAKLFWGEIYVDFSKIKDLKKVCSYAWKCKTIWT